MLNTINVNCDAVQVLDGVAYAAVGGQVESYDLLTGELLQTLSLNGSNITGLARDGSLLYAFDEGDTLHVIDLSAPLMVARGSVTLPAEGSRLFVGGGVAYVAVTPYIPPGFRTFVSGYETVDVSNPDGPKLLGTVGTATDAGQAIALNGSGLALTVGTDGFGGAGAVDLFDASDPTNTSQFLTRYALPVAPQDVAIGAGIGFIAAGSGGLQVVNYEPFDTKGIPPTASISLSPSANVTVTTSGIQATEGSIVTIAANVSDDVQVRNVELLVNGQVVTNNVSFPFDLTTTLPTIAQVGTTPVTIQVSATDTGGNTTLSNTLTLQLVPDTTPPVLLSSSIVNGIATGVLSFRSVTLEFSKPLDPTTVTADNFQLIGPDGAVIPTNIQFRRNNATVVLTYPTISVGSYQFIIHAASVTDVAGNALGSSDLISNFSVVTASAIWSNPAGGYWDVASNWLDGKVPGPTDDVLVALPPGATVIYRGNQPTVKTLTNQGTIWIQGDSAEGNAQLTVSGLLDNTGTIEIESQNAGYSSQLSTPGGQIFNGVYGTIQVAAGSGGPRSITGTVVNQGQIDVGPGTNLAISGTLVNQGQVVASSYMTISGTYDYDGGSITGPGYLYNCALAFAVSPTAATTFLLEGSGDTLAAADIPAGATLWVQGNSYINQNAVLNLAAGTVNHGTILLESQNLGYSDALATGSGTFTNAADGTIQVAAGTGGGRSITGTVVNQGQIDVDASTNLAISGTYYAAGGSITGPGYLINCTLDVTASPASPTTILIGGGGDVLATDNLAGYTLWVQGSNNYGDTIFKLGGNVANRGTILLQSVNGGYRSDINTGSYTLTNLGTISAGAGAGGERLITGTLNNQAAIDATADYVDIEGVYQAQGGTILGNGYVVNCTLEETAAPAAPSTILVSGTTTTLATDNLAGYTLWVQGSNHYGDTILKLAGNLANRGTILLQSVNQGWRSDIATGSYTLTNLGTISSGAGNGGERLVTGTLDNQAGGTLSVNQPLAINATSQTSNEGTISISAGSNLTITGSLQQSTSGTLADAVGGKSSGQYGLLAVTGAATLAGTLNVSLVNGYSPAVNDSIPILTYASKTGSFGTVSVAPLPQGIAANLVYSAANANLTFGSAQMASAAVPGPAGGPGLTLQQLAPEVSAAINLWAAAGADPAAVAELRQTRFQIADLPGAELGMQQGLTIWIDQDAAGHGWFIDTTEKDRQAFGGNGPGGEAIASPSSPAWGHMDLLTVVAHELGHVLGLGDDGGDDLMGEFLPSGTRRLPSSAVPTPSAVGIRVVTPAPTRASAAVVAVDRLVHSYSLTPANGFGSVSMGWADTAGTGTQSPRPSVSSLRPIDGTPVDSQASRLLTGAIDEVLKEGYLDLRLKAKRIVWDLFD